jgi:hypothetical protein
MAKKAASSSKSSSKLSSKKAPAKKAPAKKAPAKKAPTKKTAIASVADAASARASSLSTRAQALEAVFTALGARDPARWARSHVEDGVDQIGRFVFLRALWGRVVRDARFVDKVRKERSELTTVVERLLLAGVDEADLVALVRAMQVRLLVDACQIVDDPSDNDEGVRWGLWRMDKRGLPLWQLGDLRLDLLEVDPADDV